MPSYAATLEFLYSQLPMYQRVGPPAMKKGLGNTRALLTYLGDPHKNFLSIHIAGTNGKGTVSHMLAACYQAAGMKVGLYTSPHYQDFRERVKINGAMIGKRDVVRFVERIRPCLEEIKPSFFEITVALAFDAFAREEVDLAIVETGLGGRLDSTNVLQPLVSVITNISFDHMQMLGETLPAIAREKAGIIKPDTPVVIGTYQPTVADVFHKKAGKCKARLSYADKTLSAVLVSDQWDHQTYAVRTRNEMLFKRLWLGCSGPYQRENLLTALQTIRVVAREAGIRIPAHAVRAGLRHIRTLTAYQGRWQVLSERPLVLTDSAHNIDGLRRVLDRLGKEGDRTVHFVLGFVQDKDIRKLLEMFPANARYYFARPDVPRGADSGEVKKIADSLGLAGRAYASVRRALAAARRAARPDDLIYVGGSTFVVAEVV
ncbi:MAG: folylpolyglutamate synthase/dihydrofolate synthase family protein [Saprospiraceae bacterium]|nr:folylpolyglutamate synthase/dihydrofolate synthase family protein [Saprospiraceae bacterium]